MKAYDWIVGYADRELDREINPQALHRMLEQLEPEDAFDVGLATYGTDAGRRGFELATSADDKRIAAASALNLGHLLAEQGDVQGAVSEYGRVVEAAEPDQAALAGLNLGLLQHGQGALDAAAQAYRRAMALGAGNPSAKAALNLGALHAERGDLSGARAAFRTAQAADDVALSCQASLQLGEALLGHDAHAAEHELQRAVGSPEPEIAARSRELLNTLSKAPLLKPLSDDEALDELQRAYALECDGNFAQAEIRYRAVVEHGPYDVAAKAAFGLAELLDAQSDREGAQDAYTWAIETEDPEVADAARFALGELFAREGDPRARATLEQAAQATNPTIAEAARTKLEELT